MRYGLKEKTIESICGVFARHPAVEKAVLYGSRAKGNFKPGSDIDLTLFGDGLTLKSLGEIDEELDDLLLPYQIDLSIFDRIDNVKLREHIERVGVVFYERATFSGRKVTHTRPGSKGEVLDLDDLLTETNDINNVSVTSTMWQRRKLGEVCTAIQDGAHQSPQHQFDSPGEGRYLYITSKNIRSNYLDLRNLSYVGQEFHDQIYPRCRPVVGDVLLTKDGANTGNVALNTIDEPFSLLSSVCLIKTCRTLLLPAFLCYYIQSPDGLRSIIGQMTGAAIKRIILRDIKLASIPVPPLPEQQRIVGILDEAFAGIATAKANAEKNQQNARAAFESRLRTVLLQRGDKWEEKTVGELAKHSLGKMLDKVKNRGERKPYLRNLNVRWFTFDLSDMLEMPFLPEESAKYMAVKGDVLVCEGGYPGRAAIWAGDTPVYFQKALHRVRFHEPEHSKWFIYCLYSQDKSGDLRQHFSGTGIQHFTGQSLAKYKVPLPPLPELRRAVEEFEELHKEVQRLECIYGQKVAALDALKKSLLDSAFSGKL